ncbi:MAG: TerB family tellurite resistance protein [Pseudomonadota bacterium]
MIKRLLDALAAAPTPADKPAIGPDLAVAALLVHAARSDGDYAETEKAAIDALLSDAFDLTGDAALALRRSAEASDADASDIVRFTRVLKDALSEDERVAFLERMWRVVLADGSRDPQEDVLMRRLAGLLYVPDARSNAARRRAQASL